MMNKKLLIGGFLLIAILATFLFFQTRGSMISLFRETRTQLEIENNQLTETPASISQSVNSSDITTHSYGDCKSLVYRGDIEKKINFVFIPANGVQKEKAFVASIKEFFNEGSTKSFYSVPVYKEHKNDYQQPRRKRTGYERSMA